MLQGVFSLDPSITCAPVFSMCSFKLYGCQSGRVYVFLFWTSYKLRRVKETLCILGKKIGKLKKKGGNPMLSNQLLKAELWKCKNSCQSEFWGPAPYECKQCLSEP